jgi:hypothetical protein
MDADHGRIDRDANGPLLCARCEYRLEGLPPDGRCPECGLSIDDSIRACGLWTVTRLRRFRVVIGSFVVATCMWTAAVVLVALTPPTAGFRFALVAVGSLHALGILVTALGGAYASSRQPRGVRLVVSALFGSLLVVAAVVLGLAVLRIVPITNSIGFAALGLAAAVRLFVLVVAAVWLVLGVKLLGPHWPWQPRILVVVIGALVGLWLAAGGVAVAAFAGAFGTPAAERLVQAACVADIALLWILVGLIAPSLAAAHNALRAMATPAASDRTSAA